MANEALYSDAEAASAMEEWMDSSGEMDNLLGNESNDRNAETDAKPPESREESEKEPEDAEAVEADAEAEPAGDEADPEGDEEAPAISTIAALAEEFEVEPDDVLNALEIETPSGETMSISAAMTAWSEAEASVEARRVELEEEFQAADDKRIGEANNAAATLHGVLQIAAKTLQGHYTPERLEELKSLDPDAYFAAREAKGQLEQIIEHGIQAMEGEASRRKAMSDEDVQRVLKKERALLHKARPEWRDQKTFEKWANEASPYVKSLGFTDQEIAGMVDHRFMLVIADAVYGKKAREAAKKANVKELKKRGLKAPSKVLRSRSRKDPENPDNVRRNQLRSQLKSKGDERTAAALIEDLLD